MRLNEIARRLGLRDITPEISEQASVEVAYGHASDLLSDVLANAPSGGVLVTIQVHMNVIAVSVSAGVRAIIFTSGRVPDEAVRKRGVEEQIMLYSTEETTFDIVGRLYALGLRGKQR